MEDKVLYGYQQTVDVRPHAMLEEVNIINNW